LIKKGLSHFGIPANKKEGEGFTSRSFFAYIGISICPLVKRKKNYVFLHFIIFFVCYLRFPHATHVYTPIGWKTEVSAQNPTSPLPRYKHAGEKRISRLFCCAKSICAAFLMRQLFLRWKK
jgi:hypothetical protein